MTGTAGFVGLGAMGRPMALRLAGEPGGLWVCDVDPAAVRDLESAGATSAGTAREVAEHADHVSVMVRDDEQVRAVLHGPDGVFAAARAGLVVSVHSTIHPDTARQLATDAAERGLRLLDAPVSGGAVGAANGSLAILVGGDAAAFAAARPVLDRLGALVVHLGPPGAGTAAKLARNLIHFVAFAAVTEALDLAQAAGIDLAALGNVVRHTDAITGGPGAIMFRGATGPVAANDPWHPILSHVAALGEKDLTLAAELGDRLAVDTPLADLALSRLATGLGIAS